MMNVYIDDAHACIDTMRYKPPPLVLTLQFSTVIPQTHSPTHARAHTHTHTHTHTQTQTYEHNTHMSLYHFMHLPSQTRIPAHHMQRHSDLAQKDSPRDEASALQQDWTCFMNDS